MAIAFEGMPNPAQTEALNKMRKKLPIQVPVLKKKTPINKALDTFQQGFHA